MDEADHPVRFNFALISSNLFVATSAVFRSRSVVSQTICPLFGQGFGTSIDAECRRSTFLVSSDITRRVRESGGDGG
jgi:hypothetical protein